MSDWPPSAATALDVVEWRPHDLRVGDLIFCARSTGPLATLGRWSDEPWRHVGAVSRDHDGDLAVVENHGMRFGWRKLDEFFAAYETFGAARLTVGSSCIEAALTWMHDRADETGDDVVYAWDDLVLAGLLALTRRGAFVGKRREVRAAITAASAVAKTEHERRGKPSLTCSAFVQYAFEAAGGECVIDHERWRSAPLRGDWPAWPPRVESLDAFFDEMSDDEVLAFADHNLLELVDIAGETDRYINAHMRMSTDQLAEIVKVLVAAVTAYSAPVLARGFAHDGRWITPGDLWRSPTVSARGLLLP